MNKKPKIGIPLTLIGDKLGITLPYVNLAQDLEGTFIPLTIDAPIRTDLDLLILPGGSDINPERYGSSPGWFTQKPDLFKEYFELHHLPLYIEHNIPILGICRGHQAIAVHYGAKLIQHMYHETNDVERDGGTKLVHGIQTAKLNNQFLTGKKLKVNSRHHQVIEPTTLPKELQIIATHEKKQYHVEAIAHTEKPIIGIQYHIEDIYDDDTINWTYAMINYIMYMKKSIFKE